MKKLLVVVDYQNDFVTGPLGFPEAPRYYGRIKELIAQYGAESDDGIVFTRDVHDEGYLHTEEGRNLPVPHCLRGTEGCLFYQDLERISQKYKVFEKNTFGSLDLGKWMVGKDFDEITLVGLDLSICVAANAIIAKSAIPDAHVMVDLSASGSGDREASEHAIAELRRLQIEVRDFTNPAKGFWAPRDD